MKKIASIITLVVVVVLTTTSTVLADHTYYYTEMNNYDYTEGLRKINDTVATDWNDYCKRTSNGSGANYYTSVWKNKATALTSQHLMATKNFKSWTLPKRDDGYIYLKLVNHNSFKVAVKGGFSLAPKFS